MSFIKSIFKKPKKNDASSGVLYDIDPQLAYMWEISFKGIGSEDAENIKAYAQNTGIPAIMNDPIKRRYYGSEYTYAGRDASPKVFRVTFWDNQDLDVYHYFQKWMYHLHEPDDGQGVSPHNYMRMIVLTLLDTTGMEPIEVFSFDQCFPTEMSEASLSYDVSAPLTFDVIFSYNKRISGV